MTPLSLRPRSQRGLSLLEFTLLVAVFSLLVAFAAVRVAELRIDMERTAVQHTEAALRTALAMQFAQLYTRGQRDQILAWADGNALELLEGQATLPTRDDDTMDAAGPGDWYYDDARGEIVYEVAYPEGVVGEHMTGRWRVIVLGEGQPSGLDLETVQAIDWR